MSIVLLFNFHISMAKGNMFLGMARGKVGDVVFYRADGQQLSRVRNRNPRNPRSNAQLFQRAIMATVVQAYTAGKAIFDHSFQGYSVGAQNQREFLKRNAKMLRELIATDINTPITTNDQKGRVVAPGVSTPAINPFIISAGTYDQNLFTVNGGAFKLPEPSEGESVKNYATRLNLLPGDIYTIVCLSPRNDDAYVSSVYDDVLASQPIVDFMYARLIVKTNLTSETALAEYGQLFEVEVGGVGVDSAQNISEWAVVDQPITSIVGNPDAYRTSGAIGIIRSRRDQDLRSNSSLVVNYGSDAETMFGIASDYLLDVWKAGTVPIGDSDLILEGGEG